VSLPFLRVFDFKFPQEPEPEWSTKVDRWYQLDAPSFGLAEAIWKWSPKSRPDLLVLASPRASNESDFAFVRTGSDRAHRFAHTLPNVRSAPFCQLLHWAGPVLCLQGDPQTWLRALDEARVLSPLYPTIWIVGVFGHEPIGAIGTAQSYSVVWWSLDGESLPTTEAFLKANAEWTDSQFLRWAKENL